MTPIPDDIMREARLSMEIAREVVDDPIERGNAADDIYVAIRAALLEGKEG